jgi:hypothetical protein
MKSTTQQLHNDAMQSYTRARLSSNPRVKDRNLRHALELETQAAALLFDRPEREPTRSWLYKGAAVIAQECGEYREALRLVDIGLAGNPPDYLRAELASVRTKAEAALHLIRGAPTTSPAGGEG